MPKGKHEFPGIERVKALEPYVVCVVWDNGVTADVDLYEYFLKYARLFASVRGVRGRFEQVRVGPERASIMWDDDTEIPSDYLWSFYQWATGESMSPQAFCRWMERRGYTLDQAAEALGIGRRQVAYYRKGTYPVPKTVVLATKALTAQADEGDVLLPDGTSVEDVMEQLEEISDTVGRLTRRFSKMRAEGQWVDEDEPWETKVPVEERPRKLRVP